MPSPFDQNDRLPSHDRIAKTEADKGWVERYWTADAQETMLYFVGASVLFLVLWQMWRHGSLRWLAKNLWRPYWREIGVFAFLTLILLRIW